MLPSMEGISVDDLINKMSAVLSKYYPYKHGVKLITKNVNSIPHALYLLSK
jgi:hypothetical protein